MPATRCFNRIEDLVCDNEQLTQQQSDLQARLLVLEERQRAWDRTRRLRKDIIAEVDRRLVNRFNHQLRSQRGFRPPRERY